MKSARITGPNEPLAVSETETPKPQGNQVLVKVSSVGVCHSDLHLWEGGYDLGDGQFMKVTDRGVKYPVTPGHEIVGTVEQIGDGVSNVSVGDAVLVYPWIGCGECPACKVGNENLCDAPKSMGVFQDGGYSDYSLIPDSLSYIHGFLIIWWSADNCSISVRRSTAYIPIGVQSRLYHSPCERPDIICTSTGRSLTPCHRDTCVSITAPALSTLPPSLVVVLGGLE